MLRENFSLVQTLDEKDFAALAWLDGQKCSVVAPNGGGSSSLLFDSWGHTVVSVAGFAFLILHINSFQGKKKDQ